MILAVSNLNTTYRNTPSYIFCNHYPVKTKHIDNGCDVYSPANKDQSSDISFCGKITDEQKKKCHLTIHGTSLTCAGISGVAGEGAAVGADTIFLRGAQCGMFLILQKILDVNTSDHLMYIARQLVQGEALGVGGARILISWLGLAAEAGTGGLATPIVSPAIRAVNASLSGGITEKMGWGYVSAVERDNMTLKKQTLQTLVYGIGCALLGGSSNSLDANNPTDISEAFSHLPKETVSIYGEVVDVLLNDIHADRLGCMLVYEMIQNIILTNNRHLSKDDIKHSILRALLNTAIYDIIDYRDDKAITEETLNTVKKISENISNTPEIYNEFVEAQQKIMDKIDLSSMDTNAFLKQFKNKSFMHNFAIFSSEISSELANKWRKRNFEKLRRKNDAVNKKLQDAKQNANNILAKLSPEQQKEVVQMANTLATEAKIRLQNKTRANFALNKVSGYENIKTLVTLCIIDPIKNKSSIVPNTIMFYGPSGMGKTYLGGAIAEDCGARFIVKDIGFMQPAKWIEKIKKEINSAENTYKTSGRRTIIQVNEIDDIFNADERITEEFAHLLENVSQKSGCTFFFTTNNPLSVPQAILNKTELFIPIQNPTKDDIKKIVLYYVNDKKIKDFNIDDIVDKFFNPKNDGVYSNSQIESIIDTKLPRDCSQQDFIDIIDKTPPAVDNEVIKKFEAEKEKLKGENR